jgi:NAD+ synthase
MFEYHHADRLKYAVAGTRTGRVRPGVLRETRGRRAADVNPSRALYKTQVYALAEYLGCRRRSVAGPVHHGHLLVAAAQSQEEFYFSWPYPRMDLCLYGRNHGIPGGTGRAAATGLTVDQVHRVVPGHRPETEQHQVLHLARN